MRLPSPTPSPLTSPPRFARAMPAPDPSPRSTRTSHADMADDGNKEGMEGKDGGQKKLTLDETHVGRRVSIVWSKTSYSGVVAAFDKESGKHTIRYNDGDTKEYDMSKKQFAFEPVRRPPLVLQLPVRNTFEGGTLDLHAVLAHGDRVPRLILDLLLPATLESVRVASKGGWMFIERNLRTALVDGLLSPETTCGKLYKKWLESSPTGAPATGAEMLALCRGLQKKAVMIDLVNELQVEGVDVDAPLKEWTGITMGADGQVVEIDLTQRCKGGA